MCALSDYLSVCFTLLQKRHIEVLIECDRGNTAQSFFVLLPQNVLFVSFNVFSRCVISLFFLFILCCNVLFTKSAHYGEGVKLYFFCAVC